MDTIIQYVAESQPPRGQRFRGAGGWLISGVVHVAAIAVLASVAYAVREVAQDPVVLNPGILPTPPKLPEIKKRDVVTTPPVPLQVDEVVVEANVTTTDQADIQSLVTPDDLTDQVATPVTTDKPEPSLDASGVSGAMAFIGAGDGGRLPSGFGPKGRPMGDGRGLRPGPQVVRSLNAALRWFTRHQSPVGNWQVATYQNNCSEAGQHCEPGTANTGTAGDIACTGLALLCFLGDGNDGKHQTKYRTGRGERCALVAGPTASRWLIR